MAGARHGMCKLTTQHGNGMVAACARHAMCESALTGRLFYLLRTCYLLRETQLLRILKQSLVLMIVIDKENHATVAVFQYRKTWFCFYEAKSVVIVEASL